MDEVSRSVERAGFEDDNLEGNKRAHVEEFLSTDDEEWSTGQPDMSG